MHGGGTLSELRIGRVDGRTVLILDDGSSLWAFRGSQSDVARLVALGHGGTDIRPSMEPVGAFTGVSVPIGRIDP